MRFLPQHHERLQGIAEAAGVPVEVLVALDRASRVEVTTGPGARGLAAVIDAHSVPLILRRTVPDVGGFVSAELTAAPFAGCVAGVNREGLAVVCEGDAGDDSFLARLLAQELLLRGEDVDATVDHARRRGRYVGGSWCLVIGDAGGRTVCLEQGPSGLRVRDGLKDGRADQGLRLTINPPARSLTLFTEARPETLSAAP
jgi:hypothetical protein